MRKTQKEVGQETIRQNTFLNEHKKETLLLTLQGSRGFGLHTETSDFDIRGIFIEPLDSILGYGERCTHLEDKETDTKLYSLHRIVELLCEGNPSALSIVGYTPEDCLCVSEVGKYLLENKELFYTTRCIKTFAGYATRQLNQLELFLSPVVDLEGQQRRLLRSLRQAALHFNTAYPHVGEVKVVGDVGEDVDIRFDNVTCPLSEVTGVLREIQNIQRQYKEVTKLTGRNNRPTPQKIDKHASHLVLLYIQLLDILEGRGVRVYMGEHIPLLRKIKEGYYREGDKYSPKFFELVEGYQQKVEDVSRYTALPSQIDVDKVKNLVCECVVRHYGLGW